MNLIHAMYVKWVATGGDLAAATEHELIGKENASFKSDQKLIEKILSSNPNAKTRIRYGREFGAKFVLASALVSDLPTFHGGIHAANVYTETQDIAELADYDMRIAVKRTDNELVLIDLTHVNFVAPLEGIFKQGEQFYLPVEAKGTDETELTIDNSAA